MDKPILTPLNLTAFMQHMQRLVSTGHYLWTADLIPKEKLPGFIDKWADYGLRADATARAYRKSTKRASVHLCLSPNALSESEAVSWWMLSTLGKTGLAGQVTPGPVRDCRTQEGRLRLGDYELVELSKTVKSGNKTKRTNTWTWRLTKARYLEWEALLIEHAKSRQSQKLKESIGCLTVMPMFSGVRRQIVRLVEEANKMLGKVKCPPIELPTLAVMRMIKIWDESKGI